MTSQAAKVSQRFRGMLATRERQNRRYGYQVDDFEGVSAAIQSAKPAYAPEPTYIPNVPMTGGLMIDAYWFSDASVMVHQTDDGTGREEYAFVARGEMASGIINHFHIMRDGKTREETILDEVDRMDIR